jgi:hypothetical protein
MTWKEETNNIITMDNDDEILPDPFGPEEEPLYGCMVSYDQEREMVIVEHSARPGKQVAFDRLTQEASEIRNAFTQTKPGCDEEQRGRSKVVLTRTGVTARTYLTTALRLELGH